MSDINVKYSSCFGLTNILMLINSDYLLARKSCKPGVYSHKNICARARATDLQKNKSRKNLSLISYFIQLLSGAGHDVTVYIPVQFSAILHNTTGLSGDVAFTLAYTRHTILRRRRRPFTLANTILQAKEGCPSGEMHRMSSEIHRMSGEMHQMSSEMRRMSGEMHRMSGEMHRMSGEMRQMSGEMRRMSSEMHRMSGEMHRMSGEMRQISGERCPVTAGKNLHNNCNFIIHNS
jgi:hypothetical protein